MLRRDFRVLAFWLGSITTDASGRAHTDVTLPESLTTYRIMAVAGDKASRFGWAQNEIRINKPVLLTPAFPRFLAVGDKAYFGSVVHSQLKQGGKATVTIRSLDPSIVEINGDTTSTIDITPEGTAEVRFNAIAKSVGVARIQMSVNLNGESDAFEDVLPVRLLTPTETVAAYGEANPTARETLEFPKDVVPSIGGLHMELSSTAMVGLGEGARVSRRRIRTAARSSAPRAPGPHADLRPRRRFRAARASMRRRVGRPRSRRSWSCTSSSAATAASRTGRANALYTSPYLTPMSFTFCSAVRSWATT